MSRSRQRAYTDPLFSVDIVVHTFGETFGVSHADAGRKVRDGGKASRSPTDEQLSPFHIVVVLV
ncbi:hypothetical protein [Nocardia sp. CNY236]|uniref:hypothetical protein n=1 Tax=Nocardia sp. CNY236 TaxID=1169152 RepID=UPI0012DE0EED|nr:hypothetical protein [Nocardia sp. CNY236]